MKASRGFVLGSTTFLVFINTGVIFSQEQPAKQEAPVVQETTVTQPPNQTQTQWLWGEVVNVDANNSQLNLKTFDYENDVEKEVVIGVNEKTTYENVKSLAEIKPQDSLSIDYIIDSDGKNVAKNISLEKPEEIQNAQQKDTSAQGEDDLAPPVNVSPEVDSTSGYKF